jgi:hypothetical protein
MPSSLEWKVVRSPGEICGKTEMEKNKMKSKNLIIIMEAI